MQDSEPVKKKRGRPPKPKPKVSDEREGYQLAMRCNLDVQPILIDEELTVAATSQKIIANNLILMNRAQSQCQAQLPFATAAEASVIMERLARINSELGGGFAKQQTFNPVLLQFVQHIQSTCATS